MILECHHPFGNTDVGDTVEVPDGAVYDTAYYKPVEEPDNKRKKVDK